MAAEMERPSLADYDQDGESLMNGNVLTCNELNHNLPLKENRIIRKAKRPSKQLQLAKEVLVETDGTVDGELKAVLPNGGTAVGGQRIPFSRNSRKSRNAKGRGLPKKGGAGGKGTWGAPGSEIDVTGECSDEGDPNYDSDSQDAIVVKAVRLPVKQEEVANLVMPVLREYLEHGDSDEVADTLEDMNVGPHQHKVMELALTLALERHAPQREMTSRLISDLYGRLISQEDLARCFHQLLGELRDLTLDTPEAPQVLGQFIARAVADDCLPPKFVSGYKGHVDCPHVRSALDKADLLLSMKHGIVRLDNVWGVGGGNRPVKYLIKQMVLLLKEYLSSGDVEEATRCLRELDVPHFHHELVYEAVVMVLEDSGELAKDLMTKLLKSLTDSAVVTLDQMNNGMRRVYKNMPDICLDVPAAYTLLERFVTLMYKHKVISDAIFRELPVKGRKRFVSEGDGGKIKENGKVF